MVNGGLEGDPDGALLAMVDELLTGGTTTMPAVGNDIAAPDVEELAYDAVPVAPLRSLIVALNDLQSRLGDIRCPVLILSSPQDHVVNPTASDHLQASVSGPVERVSLDRSFHVATLDYDKELIEVRAVDFARPCHCAVTDRGDAFRTGVPT